MEIKRYCAYDKLLELALKIITLHQDIKTVNPLQQHYELTEEITHKKAIELYHLLIHSMTCLHHKQRDTTVEGKYISEDDDCIVALSLLQQILPLPEYTLSESELRLYITLYNRYGTKQFFTCKEIKYARYYTISTTKRIIGKLKKMGILTVEGNPYRGYKYRLAK